MTIEAKRQDNVAHLQILCGNDLVVELAISANLPVDDVIKNLWEDTLDYFNELSDSLFDDKSYKVRLIDLKTQAVKEEEIYVPLRNNPLNDSLASTESSS